MKIDKIILGDFKTNCYIISHNGIAFIIDPACNGKNIDSLLKEKQLDLKAIFLTHGHFDHIGAVDYLYKIYSCPIFAHINDKDFYEGKIKLFDDVNCENIKIESPINYFDGEFKSFSIDDDIILDAILTPGHSNGSVTYVLRNFFRIFSGDTIMKETIGRTDFQNSNIKKMEESIEIYKTFIDECKVHPGHGNSSTIKEIKEKNPFFMNLNLL